MTKNADNQIAPLTQDVKKLEKATIKAINISSEPELKAAGELLAKVKASAKQLKDEKKKLVDPLKEQLDGIKDRYKPSEDILKNLEEKLKEAMLQYNTALEEKARKEADRIERRINKGTMKIETGMAKLSSIDQAHTSISGAQFRKGKEQIRITDINALLQSAPALLARERVLEALRLEITADWKDGKELPDGVEIYRKQTVAGIAG